MIEILFQSRSTMNTYKYSMWNIKNNYNHKKNGEMK